MGGILSQQERDRPMAPNGVVLVCPRCATPALVGTKCSWCNDYPELDKKGKLIKFRSTVSKKAPSGSILDVSAHTCPSCGCHQAAVVVPCSWCGAWCEEDLYR